jgi:quercetin dioxygenase-like cupin family protein
MTDARPTSPGEPRDTARWTSFELTAAAGEIGDPTPGAARERAARSLFQSDTLGAVLTNLAAGASMENEDPDESATIQGVRGTCRVALESESVDLNPGTLVAVAAGIAWRLEATSDATVLVTVARSRR